MKKFGRGDGVEFAGVRHKSHTAKALTAPTKTNWCQMAPTTDNHVPPTSDRGFNNSPTKVKTQLQVDAVTENPERVCSVLHV